MSREEEEDFHDSDCDIFDLFNATNGILRQDGLLDISQLEQYSPQEAEEINVPRLRAIWEHAAADSGCPECARTVSMLREIRGVLREDDEESFDKPTGGSDADISNSVS